MVDIDDILIVGGGIAGLTLAAALEQRGFRAQLVERDPAWCVPGAGLAVQANGMRVLGRLGLAADVVKAGTALRRWVLADQRGAVLCDVPFEALYNGVGPSIGVMRASLQRALLAGSGSAERRLGISVVSLAEGDGQVVVRFTDGTTGRYDLVVGADGINSAVREHALGRATLTSSGQVAWRSVAPLPLPGTPSVQFWLGEGCFFGLCAVGDGRTYGFGNALCRDARDPLDGRLDRLRSRFAAFGSTVQEYLARLERDEQIHVSAIAWVERPAWHTRRVVLIGDAAHATSPMMGQGASLAMEDAWVLAEALRTEQTLGRALASYAARRRARVDWVQRQSRAIAEAFAAPRVQRDAMLRTRGAELLRERFAPLAEEP